MKFIAFANLVVLALVGIVTGIEVAGPAPAPAAAVKARNVGPGTTIFGKRQGCVASSCLCNMIPGDFCGDETINPSCTDGHAFHCAADGSTCDFGFELGCSLCGELFCHGLPT